MPLLIYNQTIQNIDHIQSSMTWLSTMALSPPIMASWEWPYINPIKINNLPSQGILWLNTAIYDACLEVKKWSSLTQQFFQHDIQYQTT